MINNLFFIYCEICGKRILKIKSVIVYLCDDIKFYYKTRVCKNCANNLERKI
jgi:hypothetical protein